MPSLSNPLLSVLFWPPGGRQRDFPTDLSPWGMARELAERYLAGRDEKGDVDVGHVALRLDVPDGGEGPLYLSLYPASLAHVLPAPTLWGTLRRASANVPGRFSTFEEDLAVCGPHYLSLSFSNFDETALRCFVDSFRQRATYNLAQRSCASSVATALDAGLEEALSSTGFLRALGRASSPTLWCASGLRGLAEAMAWSPGLAFDYARVLHRLTQPGGPAGLRVPVEQAG